METIIILDSGTRYSQMIARRVRECRVYSEILPLHTSIDRIRRQGLKGIIFVKDPSEVNGLDNSKACLNDAIYDLNVPILEIHYGSLSMVNGAENNADSIKNISGYDKADVRILDSHKLFKALEDLDRNAVAGWIDTQNTSGQVPPESIILTTKDNIPIGSVSKERKIYTVQLHPEFFCTEYGKKIIDNFVTEICKCNKDWTMEHFIHTTVEAIRNQVGSKQIVCGLSGGIDSSVAAILVHRAVGSQLTCIYVDHGFMRKQESKQVINTFSREFKMNLVSVNAEKRFLAKMVGVTDPEQKRKIIGTEFIRVFEDEARKLGEVDFLVQGTLYSDVVESGVAQTNVIKTHHNVGGLPDDVQFELVEPLRALFKDEVRLLANALGLPTEIVWRHPFPGPGLAIRIIGEVTKEKLRILQEVDAIYLEEIRRANLYRDIWQAFAVLTNTRTVGVTDNKRTYEYVVALRAIVSEDGMTADWVRIPYPVLERISSRILQEVKGVNRVTYDISSKPPATIEWE